MKRKIFLILMMLSILCFNYNSLTVNVNAYEFEYNSDVNVYKIYDENLNLLFERDEVELGDNYMSKDYKFYEIVYLDSDNLTGIAKFIKNIDKPEISRSNAIVPIKIEERVICMYMTHNDESYVPTDGVDSVYGNGGILDVAKAFKSELERYMIDVYLDDSLHIPHDTSAYSRSQKTAQNLKSKYSPDAIFDIHRDGASRAYYVANVNGKERGRVRIVIGKANPNMELNEEFATYLLTIGNELYPWLFTDIYYAKGHYNQSLDSKAILFEMGSHLVEKNLEIESMKELAEVVTTALYQTTLNTDTGELTVNGAEDEVNVILKDAMNDKQSKKSESVAIAVVVILTTSMLIYASILIWGYYKKKNN